MPPLYIALEGWDSVGKTTQTAALAQRLGAAGHTVVTTREPGGTELGVHLRQLLLTSDGLFGDSSRAETLLFAADCAAHMEQVIAPALAAGHTVVSDRAALGSAIPYQCAGRGHDTAPVAEVYRWAAHGVTPDLTFCLSSPWEVAWRRFCATRHMDRDRIEQSGQAFHRRVHARYVELATTCPQWHLIDADDDVVAVTDQLVARVQQHLAADATQPAAR